MGAVVKHWDPTYVKDGAGGADITGGWIEIREGQFVVLQADWSAFAATAGTIALQGSNDHILGATANPSAQSIVTLTALVTHGAQPSGGTAGALVLTLENPTVLIRAKYTRSGGGTTSQFQMRLLVRGC